MSTAFLSFENLGSNQIAVFSQVITEIMISKLKKKEFLESKLSRHAESLSDWLGKGIICNLIFFFSWLHLSEGVQPLSGLGSQEKRDGEARTRMKIKKSERWDAY